MTICEMNNPFDIGLREIIKSKGIKQTYVAEKAGMTPQELSDMLNGRKLIKACDILRFSLILGVSADDIYTAGEVGKYELEPRKPEAV